MALRTVAKIAAHVLGGIKSFSAFGKPSVSVARPGGARFGTERSLIKYQSATGPELSVKELSSLDPTICSMRFVKVENCSGSDRPKSGHLVACEFLTFSARFRLNEFSF